MTGATLATLHSPFAATSSGVGALIAWSPDGTLLALGSTQLALVCATTGATVAVLPLRSLDLAALIAWSPDGTRLAVAGAIEQGSNEIGIGEVWQVAKRQLLICVSRAQRGRY